MKNLCYKILTFAFAIILSVNVWADPPANDDCSNAIAIGEVTEMAFSTQSATPDGNGSCIEEGGNVWYIYTSTFTGTARLEANGDEFYPQIAIYNGYSCSPLPEELVCNNDFPINFAVISGQSYLVEIGGYAGESGNGLLTINEAPSAPTNDSCANADDAGTLSSGETAQLTGTSEGATQDCYMNYYPEVWIQFTVPSCMNIAVDYCDDANNVWEVANYLFPDCSCSDYLYSNSWSTCENYNPSVKWHNVEAGTYYYPIWAVNNGGGPYTVNVTGVDCPPPPEPDFIVTAPYSETSTTCGAGNDCYLYYSGEDHIYEVTIPTDGNWVFSFCNSASNWGISVYIGTDICENNVECSQNECENELYEYMVTGMEAGIYYLTIDGYDDVTCGEYTLDIYELPEPCEGSYYTNGDPDYEDGIASYRGSGEKNNDFFACDDFTITEDVTFDSIKFICAFGYGEDTFFNSIGDYQIITSDGGVPGTVLYEGEGEDCSRVPTGNTYNEEDEVYAYQFDDLEIELPAGTYFLACRTVSSSTYWLTTGSQTGSTAYYKEGDGEWTLSEVNADLVFCLFGTTSGGDTYDYLPGDANMINGQWPPKIIGADVTYLVGYFRGINGPCLIGGFYNSADANGDCLIIGSDVTRLVSYFRGLSSISYCPNYPPTWLVPEDCPTEAPGGWPNCEIAR